MDNLYKKPEYLTEMYNGKGFAGLGFVSIDDAITRRRIHNTGFRQFHPLEEQIKTTDEQTEVISEAIDNLGHETKISTKDIQRSKDIVVLSKITYDQFEIAVEQYKNQNLKLSEKITPLYKFLEPFAKENYLEEILTLLGKSLTPEINKSIKESSFENIERIALGYRVVHGLRLDKNTCKEHMWFEFNRKTIPK